MKKILSILLLVIFLSSSISRGAGDVGCIQDGCDPGQTCNQETKQCEQDPSSNNPTNPTTAGPATTPTKESTTSPVNGITINEKCLLNGQCKYDIYDTLGIRKSVRATGDPTSVGLFVQDIILSATFFIGTVVTLALIVSGLMYIFAGATGKDPATAKKGITGSLIGLLIVSSSYLIIRLIQYIAKGM